jgi:hypothetical protein
VLFRSVAPSSTNSRQPSTIETQSWQNKREQRREVSIQFVDVAFEANHLRWDDTQGLSLRLCSRLWDAKIGTKIEQIILHAKQTSWASRASYQDRIIAAIEEAGGNFKSSQAQPKSSRAPPPVSRKISRFLAAF